MPDRLGPHADALARSPTELSRRLTRIFLRDDDGRRPVFGGETRSSTIRTGATCVPFHEYFHGDTGAGVGASHQTGWTALVAKLLQQQAGRARRASPASAAAERVVMDSRIVRPCSFVTSRRSIPDAARLQ